MNRPVQLAIVLIVVTALAVTGMFVFTAPAAADRETLSQIGSLNDLVAGQLGGIETVGTMLERGDFGLGTFEGLDGEMIVLGGRCYKALNDGTVVLAGNGEVTPFAQVGRFDIDGTVSLADRSNLSTAVAQIGAALPSDTCFYLLRIHGTFENITVRSVPGQVAPYPTLADVVANQTVFSYQNLSGTMVGIWSPPDSAGLSWGGFHFHFISDDLSKGGHVLAFEQSGLFAEWDTTYQYDVELRVK